MSKIIEIVSQILNQLGANQTVYVQIAVFIIAIGFLTTVVYNPYFKAADVRHQKTKGADAVAKEATAEAKNLQAIYQTKARALNDKIKNIFENKKSDALKKSAEIISQSKVQAEHTANEARKTIDQQLKIAEQDVEKIAGEIANTLKDKFEKGL